MLEVYEKENTSLHLLIGVVDWRILALIFLNDL